MKIQSFWIRDLFLFFMLSSGFNIVLATTTLKNHKPIYKIDSNIAETGFSQGINFSASGALRNSLFEDTLSVTNIMLSKHLFGLYKKEKPKKHIQQKTNEPVPEPLFFYLIAIGLFIFGCLNRKKLADNKSI